MFEILEASHYSEYEEFVKTHPRGNLLQSVLWHAVKHNWLPEVVVLREQGKIVAGISVLVRKMPPFRASLLYAPRGPVCDYTDKNSIANLQKGIDFLAKKHAAYQFTIDPDEVVADEELAQRFTELGFVQELGGDAFENIQARFNYRLYLQGRTQEELMANFHHKTRYNIRLSARRGVEVKVVGKDGLDDFMRLMTMTGQRDDFTTRSQGYFENMLDNLGENIRLYLAYFEGEAIAGSIATNYAGKTCYLYGCSSNEHRNVMSTYLLQWEMIQWAAETNCTVYDLQGISGNYLDENDPLSGLFQFKNGFSGQVDELLGEFHYTYRPFVKKMIEKAIACNDWLRAVRRKRGGA